MPFFCFKCPKVYHAKCQGIVNAPKKFICSWHECLCCRRRPGDVGGLLIQCTGCPKAFCIDCFPTSFRRVYPEDSFFEKLQNMGWESCSPETMVNFQCNDCRARVELEEKNAIELEEARLKEREANERERRKLKFEEIAVAYEILSDEVKRAKYDNGEDVSGSGQQGQGFPGGFPGFPGGFPGVALVHI